MVASMLVRASLPRTFPQSGRLLGHSIRILRTDVRCFHSGLKLQSEVNPAYPDESHLVKVKKPNRPFAEYIDPSLRLGMNPLYTAPMGGQMAFTKRWTLGVSACLGYIGYMIFDYTGGSLIAGTAATAIAGLPFPVLHYFSSAYVTRIFRVYKKDEPQTYENMIKDETLVLERIGFFGRRTYGTEVKLADIRLVEKRAGWVNWEYRDPQTGLPTNFYVADNIGGIKMDRIWGIIEKNSGVDNGRGFLDEK